MVGVTVHWAEETALAHSAVAEAVEREAVAERRADVMVEEATWAAMVT